ncbi:hypothetical protein [Planctomyces sp. SH-PL14]|uniref:hypothetical protein n=1 Tax=Planctomyces sp. SH-PL14 TaxID=1632864 RepID=UPI00078B58D5|nr:hypothetical protein [Planctomyces sp. SH-PL14]AMV20669.1 hypothetical protein VT03_22405 [Planctomyces sp. SH-PL14]
MRLFFLIAATFLLASSASAEGLYFPNRAATSPSGSYDVEAKPPDNQKGEHWRLQDNLVYVCSDTANAEVLWTRRQPMERFVQDADGGFRLAHAGDMHEDIVTRPLESSPKALLVSDSGWTVIRTYGDRLVVIAPNGDVVGTVAVVEDAFRDEDKKHVRDLGAGFRWSGNSLWYFLMTAEGEFLVIRPWWGRRVFLSVHAGTLAGCDREVLSIAAAAEEREIVLRTLRAPVDMQYPGDAFMTAAYLAGVLSIPEAVPLLRGAENSPSFSFGLSFEALHLYYVDPMDLRQFRLRQIAQLSLRRLGEKPASLPCYQVHFRVAGEAIPFSPTPIEPQRHENVAAVKLGMKPRDVLLALGSPDVVWRTDTWNYDMDAPEPFSVAITFSEGRVTKIERRAAEWKDGLTRDEQVSD